MSKGKFEETTELAIFIQEEMNRQNITSREMCDRAVIADASLSMFLNFRTIPKHDTLCKILRVLGLKFAIVFDTKKKPS